MKGKESLKLVFSQINNCNKKNIPTTNQDKNKAQKKEKNNSTAANIHYWNI